MVEIKKAKFTFAHFLEPYLLDVNYIMRVFVQMTFHKLPLLCKRQKMPQLAFVQS